MRIKKCKFIWLILICLALVFSSAVSCGAAKSDNGEKNSRIKNNERANITFELFDKSYRYEDKLMLATDHTVEEVITKRKINAPLEEKLKMVDKCISAGSSFRNAINYCFPLLTKSVDNLIEKGNIKPQDSIITFDPAARPMFKISKEIVGYSVNENRLYQDIYIALRKNAKTHVKVIPQEIKPSVTALDNIKLTELRSSFTTDYSASNDNRKHNIQLSLSKINGTVLMPGEEFSFNKTVGRRTAKNGFKEAKIIKDFEYVLGYGGGVCQSSTTLYNAAIRADMKIIMANSHSLPPAYVPPSFDAMVNSASSDLKFKNDSLFPVFIRAVGTDTTALVEFYGMRLPYKISVQSVEIFRGEVPRDNVIIDIDKKYVLPETPSGEPFRVSYGHAAIKSEGYLVFYDAAGNIIERKLLRRDSYGSNAGIIAIAP